LGTVLKRAIVLLIATCSLIGRHAAASPLPSAPVFQNLYADASAKEKAVRAAMADPRPPAAVLKAVRSVVADYEQLVRSNPAAAFSDNALWAAGKLSLDAFRKFRDRVDKDTGTRLLQTLAADYPSSSFAKQVPAALAAVSQIAPQASTPTAATSATAAAAPTAATPATTAMSAKGATSATASATATNSGSPLPTPTGATGGAQAAPPAQAPSQASRARSKIITIKDIRRASLADVVRIVIELDGEVLFEEDRLEDPARVFVDLASTDQAAELVERTQPGGRAGERVLRFDGDSDLVRQVRIGKHTNSVTRVVLDATGVSSYSVYPLYSPYRLVIDCIRANPAAGTAVASAKPSPAAKTPPAAPAHVPPAVPTKSVAAPPPVKPEVITPASSGPAPTAAAPAPVEPVPVPALPTVPVPGPPPAEPARNIAGGFSIARQLGLSVSRIVIDPGHGGHDPGAKTPGQTEAELVLDVALKLEKLLAQVPGVEVVLTRRADEFISLQERTAIANRENADLFLSIHANAHRNREIGGVETYFLNFATNSTAEAVAARENATSAQPMSDAPNLIKAIALNNKLDESKDFAAIVQRSMVSKLKSSNKTVKDLGVKQAPFVVLIGATMPSVLAEVSFLTNTQDGRLLKTSAYRQKIAEALFDAVRNYQTSLKKIATVAGTPQ
jgi:N-acetylmuramoyl-L-alanine amidase